MSSNVWTLWKRLPADVGLYLRIGMLRTLEELRHFRAGLEPNPRLLPVRALALEPALALELAVLDLRPHGGDLRVEQLFHGAADVHLGGVHGDLEHNDLALLAGNRRLLCNERASDDLCGLHPSTSCSRSIAARVAMMRVVFITSRAVSRPLATTVTPAMLRADNRKLSSRRASTTSVRDVAPRRFSSAAVAFVFFSAAFSSSTTTIALS